tara:strand:+ start:7564 stop:7818 length:255 start_codon:yes stop_codon:yes gene_type:complete
VREQEHRIGDLVHIPQAVVLIDYDTDTQEDPQLTIPLNIHETQKPEIAVVTNASDVGYLRVFWGGKCWSVKNDRVYSLKSCKHD